MARPASILSLISCALLVPLTACAPDDDEVPGKRVQNSERKQAMSALPSDLVGAIERRIADPVRRHDDIGGVSLETLSDPSEVFARLEREIRNLAGPRSATWSRR